MSGAIRQALTPTPHNLRASSSPAKLSAAAEQERLAAIAARSKELKQQAQAEATAIAEADQAAKTLAAKQQARAEKLEAERVALAEKLAREQEAAAQALVAEQKAIEQKANTVGAVVGLMVNVANTVSEKADTRSWLSLPACVNYVRIPLKPGVQTITVSNSRMKKEIKITGEKGVQIRSVTLY